MGFRFRKRIKLFPGLWLNASRSGISASIGGHGLTANISKKGVRETVGLPGTGISYQTKRVRIGQQRATAKGQRRSVTPRRVSWRSLLSR
jgi:hypothetical protein